MTTSPAGTRSLSERVAEEIRVVMLRRRITGAQLAARLNVSPAWVSYRLSGKQAIDLNDLESIARILDVPVQSLLPNGPAERVLTIGGSPASTITRTTDRPHAATITSPRGSTATAIRRPRRRPGHATGSELLATAGMVME